MPQNFAPQNFYFVKQSLNLSDDRNLHLLNEHHHVGALVEQLAMERVPRLRGLKKVPFPKCRFFSLTSSFTSCPAENAGPCAAMITDRT